MSEKFNTPEETPLNSVRRIDQQEDLSEIIEENYQFVERYFNSETSRTEVYEHFSKIETIKEKAPTIDTVEKFNHEVFIIDQKINGIEEDTGRPIVFLIPNLLNYF